MEILFAILIVILLGCICLYRSSKKTEQEFANRPSVITNPAKDLFINEKYAIVRLLAYVQGANSISAYSDEASKIVQSTIFELGLSQKEVVKVLRVSMSHAPERQLYQILSSLDEIKDRKYLHHLYEKCSEIATISYDVDTIEAVEHIFKELKVI